MQLSGKHYFSLAWPFLLALAVLFAVLAVLVEVGILKYACERLGVPPRYVLAVLLSLLGSAANIPLFQLPPEQIVSG